ncbi:MAG: MinD/ParA family protein, partial [Steroidobacteraceae bacterium]|nr:MinD/ParA family protein [Steroidobacteraceae bacterium]
MHDHRLPRNQADNLARLNAARPVKVLAVTGGKGGVGKTT